MRTRSEATAARSNARRAGGHSTASASGSERASPKIASDTKPVTTAAGPATAAALNEPTAAQAVPMIAAR